MGQIALWAFAGIGVLASVAVLFAVIGEYATKITRMRCDKIIQQAHEIIQQEKGGNKNA